GASDSGIVPQGNGRRARAAGPADRAARDRACDSTRQGAGRWTWRRRSDRREKIRSRETCGRNRRRASTKPPTRPKRAGQKRAPRTESERALLLGLALLDQLLHPLPALFPDLLVEARAVALG